MSDSGIFKVAVKLSPERRAAYLDQACGSNHALRREVESLLQAHDEPGSFLRGCVAQQSATVDGPPSTETPGAVIGPYKLLQQIKFARMHRTALVTASSFAILLVAGVVVSTWRAVRATSAEKTAKRAEFDANQERLAALVAKQQALEAKTEADRQRAEADKQRDEARLAAYASGVGLAQRAWEEGNVVRARELLEEVPRAAAGRNLRGFEWFYLSRLCHPDELTLKGHAG